jgi:hypothetical protein
MYLLFYPLVGFDTSVTNTSLKYEHRSKWNIDHVKFALTLIKKWPSKNEVIDLHHKKNSKNYHIRNFKFQIHSSKS